MHRRTCARTHRITNTWTVGPSPCPNESTPSVVKFFQDGTVLSARALGQHAWPGDTAALVGEAHLETHRPHRAWHRRGGPRRAVRAGGAQPAGDVVGGGGDGGVALAVVALLAGAGRGGEAGGGAVLPRQAEGARRRGGEAGGVGEGACGARVLRGGRRAGRAVIARGAGGGGAVLSVNTTWVCHRGSLGTRGEGR